MKLYDYAAAPNPRRVRIFLAEKNIQIETVQIDLAKLEQKSEAFLKLSPLGEVPLLQLDDGTCISQVHAICRYIEEVYPENPLLGRTPLEKALVESSNHQLNMNGIVAVADGFRNSNPVFADRALPGPNAYAQIPALAERGLARVDHLFRDLDAHFANSEFVIGDYFSVADITAFTTIGFARWIKKTIPEDCVNLQRWYDQVNARPSAKA
ncbi:glutathione S-transferase family protein [Porticoccaceae bacterium]|nr:glutathione S-transferase family protein [Porticoccaceae bacterium]